MRYVIERDEDARWMVVAYTEDGRLGAKVHCATTDDVMRVFLLLAGHITHDEPRSVDMLDPDTAKIAS